MIFIQCYHKISILTVEKHLIISSIQTVNWTFDLKHQLGKKWKERGKGKKNERGKGRKKESRKVRKKERNKVGKLERKKERKKERNCFHIFMSTYTQAQFNRVARKLKFE